MSSKVFVGNLNFDTTEDELRSLFSEVADPTSVAVPTDRMTGRPRGFAFVEFQSDEQAEQAIQRFDGYELAGRKLRVNEAMERPPRSASGGFSRPFGGGGAGTAGGADRFAPRSRPKGSRRNVRARKRSIW
jgi:RNA recognition motif-containing protein